MKTYVTTFEYQLDGNTFTKTVMRSAMREATAEDKARAYFHDTVGKVDTIIDVSTEEFTPGHRFAAAAGTA